MRTIIRTCDDPKSIKEIALSMDLGRLNNRAIRQINFTMKDLQTHF